MATTRTKKKAKAQRTPNQIKADMIKSAKSLMVKVMEWEAVDHSSHMSDQFTNWITRNFDGFNGRDMHQEIHQLKQNNLKSFSSSKSAPVAKMTVQGGGSTDGVVHTSRSNRNYQVQTYSKQEFSDAQKKSQEAAASTANGEMQVQKNSFENRAERKEEKNKVDGGVQEAEIFNDLVKKTDDQLVEEFGGLGGLVDFVNEFIPEESRIDLRNWDESQRLENGIKAAKQAIQEKVNELAS